MTKRGTVWSLSTGGVLAATTGPADDSMVDAVVGLLPSPEHQAFARLGVATMVARWHLGDTYVNDWPALIMYGGVATGKTLMGRVVTRLGGCLPGQDIYVALDHGWTDLLGRRVQLPGGAWSFAPAPSVGRPAVCIDELDSTSGDAQRAALRMCMGESIVELEGRSVRLRATPIVTLNGDRRPGWLHDKYVRRSFVFDTGPTGHLVPRSQVDASAAQLLRPGAIPALDLDRLRPTVDGLPEELDRLLSVELPSRFLTARGRDLYPARGLVLTALGYTALGRDVEAAVIEAGRDYLLCAITCGGSNLRAVHGWVRNYGGASVEERVGEVDVAGLEHDELAEQIGFAEEVELTRDVLRRETKALSKAKDDEGIRLRGGLKRLDDELAAVTA